MKYREISVIDLNHDTHHFCNRFKTDGIKAMSRGFLGDKQLIESANTRNRGLVGLFDRVFQTKFVPIVNCILARH